MGLLWLYTIVFLLSERCDFVIGVDDFTVQFEGQKTCFEENTHISLVVDYTGSGTPDSLRWKFSKMSNPVDTLNIVTSICIAGVADPAFPVSRMSYTCDNHKKSYTINITDFNESSDAGTWEVAISVDGAFTNFKSVTVTVKKCPASSDSEGKWNMQWLSIVCFIIVVVVILILVIYKNWERIWKCISKLFNIEWDLPAREPPLSSFPEHEPHPGETIHGNPNGSNQGASSLNSLEPETPSQNDLKTNTTPPSNLGQTDETNQRNDQSQGDRAENQAERRPRLQLGELRTIIRNFWNSLSPVVCKSASNNTVNAGNDPDKETGL